MKFLKFNLFIFMGIIIFNINLITESSASTDEITWTMDTSEAEYNLVGDVDFETGTNELDIEIAPSSTHLLDNGTTEFVFNFYNISDVLTDQIDGKDFYNFRYAYDFVLAEWYDEYNFVGSYDWHHFIINFDAYNISASAVRLEIIFPQTYTSGSPHDSAYIDYMNEESVYISSPSGELAGLFNWYYEATGSHDMTGYLVSNLTYVDDGAEYLSLVYSSAILYRIFDLDSNVYFYDSAEELLGSIDMVDYLIFDYENEGVYNNITINLTTLSYYQDIEYFNVRHIIYQYAPNIFYTHATAFFYYFNFDVLRVNFYSQDVVIYTRKTVVGAIPFYLGTTPTKTDYNFSHWIVANGTTWNNTAVSDDMVTGGVVNFYAVFIKTPTAVDVGVTDPTADEDSIFTNALTILGFNDPIERTIIFGIVALITASVMIWKRISIIATVVVVGLELFFFMYLGLIPAFVSIIMVLLLLVVGWSLRGGVSNE